MYYSLTRCLLVEQRPKGQPQRMNYLTPSRPAPPAPMSRSASASSAASGSNSYFNASNASLGRLTGGEPSTPSYGATTPIPQASRSLGKSSGPTDPATIVRRGYVSVKEEGLKSWIWSKRWLVLRERALSMHKNDVCRPHRCHFGALKACFSC